MTNSPGIIRRTLALVFFVCACAHVAARAQQQAYKIDETDYTRCDLGEVPHVTDFDRPLFVALKEHPQARVAVIVRGPLPSEAMTYAREVRLWLTESRGVVSERLLDLYGGPAPKMRLELRLVPEGAEPPSAPPVEWAGVTLFRTYNYEGFEACPSQRQPALEVFAETLKRMPGWRATIVLRPHVNRRGAEERGEWDTSPLTRRTASRHAVSDRLYLVRQLGLDSSRIRIVIGAPDNVWAHAELWLVPPGSRK